MNLKVNIVIPFYKNYNTIEKLLNSIQDQDYKNYDVTIVQDGKDLVANQVFKDYSGTLFPIKECEKENLKSLINIQLLEDNKGASYARNYGAKLTQGDILFFVDADCELYPGMLREIVTQFEINPDIDFVYGNYRFDRKQEFYSMPFDPYQLETMNYICTMSPIRREAFEKVGGFKEDEKYFQDWSLFYRIVKAGYKGKYINEFIFTTEYPKENSISSSQGLTLSQKAKTFRDTQEIKERQLVVTTFGAPLQSIQRAKMLNADYVGLIPGSKRQIFPSNLQFENWKATFLVGLFNHPITALENHLNACVGRPIIQFIGTDVWQLLNYHSFNDICDIKKVLNKINAKLFVNSKNLRDELNRLNINAEVLYSPIYDFDKYQSTHPLPKIFTVGVYFSDSPNMNAIDGAQGLSNVPLILDTAMSMPDINFKFFGADIKLKNNKYGEIIDKHKNIEFCGRISEKNMVDFINSCSATVRATIHDGLPHLPIQFLLCGRKALVSSPDEELRFVERLSFQEIDDYEAAKSELIEKIYALSSIPDIPETDSIKAYYKDLLNQDKFINRIYEVMNETN